MDTNEAICRAFKEYQSGNLHEAEYIFKKILEVQPNNSDIYNGLANVLHDSGKLEESIACYLRAIILNPNFFGTYYNLGDALNDIGNLDEAIMFYRKAIELNPGFSWAYNNLALALKEKGQIDEAISYCKRAIEIDPTFCDAYHNLGNAYYDRHNFVEAVFYYQKALEYCPNHTGAYTNLGNVLKDKGQLVEAEKCYRTAIRMKPDDLIAHEALLMATNYDSRYDAKTIFMEHLNFSKKYLDPLSLHISPHRNRRDPARRLKIGYVSPDFRKHAVAYFIESVIMSHDHKNFDVFCYSTVQFHDEVTKRIQGYANQWRSIAGISDEQASELIRNDEIDILVDLAGYTADNRILVFARKPAPIQISWIGYLSTTGMSVIDYRITDKYADPPGLTEQFYSEKLVRLPESFLCYLPVKCSPGVGPLPALSSGHITFGSFNNFAKVSPEVFSLWSNILKALPDSRLIMKTWSFSDEMTRHHTMGIFSQQGINPERITLLPADPSPKHLESYNRIDIGLDTFPFNGGATTCEALWMGVPVITLSGTAYASRTGVSLLSNVGLPELVAYTREQYVCIALSLANNINKLELLRKSLRSMMVHSPLNNAKHFTANLESCYRKIWEEWCNAI